MWRHEAGRIDFDGPLSRLWQRGWVFRESAPIRGAHDDGHWSVIGILGEARVRGDRPERRDAWAEAVRLALAAVAERESFPLSLSPSGAIVDARRHPSRSTRPSQRPDPHRGAKWLGRRGGRASDPGCWNRMDPSMNIRSNPGPLESP